MLPIAVLASACALADVWKRLVVPSVISSESPLSSLNASLAATEASTYALTDCCEGNLVALLEPMLSSSINAAVILASALAFV